MGHHSLIEQFDSLAASERFFLSMLALYGEPLGKTRILECLRAAGLRDLDDKAYVPDRVGEVLARLRRQGLVAEKQGAGFTCQEGLVAPAIGAAIADGVFDKVCNALRASWGRPVFLYSYRQAIARLRVALLSGQPPQEVHKWLSGTARFYDFNRLHPYVEILCRPFEPKLLERLHPAVEDEVLALLLAHSEDEPELAPALRNRAEEYLARPDGDKEGLVLTLAEHWLLCGRLDEAWNRVKESPRAMAQHLRAAILALRGDHAAALAEFAAGLKALRNELGRRNVYLGGICGYLYVLTMMRAEDPKARRLVDTYLNTALRDEGGSDYPVYFQLYLLSLVQGGTVKAEAALDRTKDTRPCTQLFQALCYYWLGLAEIEAKRAALAELAQRAEAAGFDFIAAQAAELLGRLGEAGGRERAAELRRQHGFVDLGDWFERQEPWQRQLSALARLKQTARASKSEGPTRLAWLISFDPKIGYGSLEPREQKRDARGNWSKGRPVALKRLREQADQLEFATPQDLRVFAAISDTPLFYGGSRYEIHAKKALAALIGHPLVFWQDAPVTRVEVLRGEPELMVRASGRKLKLSLHPAIDPEEGEVLVTKEAPTRLRVIDVTEEHRRIAAIVGGGITVPTEAREQVLDTISALSSLLTVQSDIGSGAADVEQVEADPRLHVHLLPYRSGLRLQILVRPFAEGGQYYPPGHGAESVIAEIAGKPRQARRDLAAERAAAAQLIAACPALNEAEESHGEWLLEEPESCLELLLELKQRSDGVVIAWPEGERFRVGPEVGFSQFRLTIKRDNDWFAVGGELEVDEQKVLDLRKLLELVKVSPGRFISLGGNEYLALTEEFRRRVDELGAFADAHANGARVHALAAFALEELADGRAQVQSDRHWEQHIERLRKLDTLQPQLPGTLQAELRDYQHTGFVWLSRLAYWGVGACLADDMGVGKTVQALALLLARAPQGPALVVAPTSVCMNWVAEAARFAPTLRLILFGARDREQTLAALRPFDLLVASYGLLQQEAERFASVTWHTIVLDEAQAIKNRDTKRSQAAMALSGDFKLIATGTPLENHLGELWNLFRFINPGLLGSLERFNQRFAIPIEKQQDPQARARLRKLIHPFILRRTKSQVLAELPPRTEILRGVDLSESEAALYEALRCGALERLANVDSPAGQRHIQILAEIMKLRRACCNPHLVAPGLKLPSSKLAVFGELLDELIANRHKALVFSQFVDHLTLIRAYLDKRGVTYQYLDGATPIEERKARVDAFQAGVGDLFLISLKAGGTGLNLTAADYVIHMDPWWNPAVEDQASDRAHRMGQQRPVTIYRLVAKHTIEEKIVDLHRHKRTLADSLLEGSDLSDKMSAEELLLLLQEEESRG
jgi:superfamily II DNA or RNA helicase